MFVRHWVRYLRCLFRQQLTFLRVTCCWMPGLVIPTGTTKIGASFSFQAQLIWLPRSTMRLVWGESLATMYESTDSARETVGGRSQATLPREDPGSTTMRP